MKQDIENRTFWLTLICSLAALISYGYSTFATVTYVDKSQASLKEIVEINHSEDKQSMQEVKSALNEINAKLWNMTHKR